MLPAKLEEKRPIVFCGIHLLGIFQCSPDAFWLHRCEMIVCMMTPSMEHHQPPFWISEASWKAPPRVCFCVSFSKYCSLSLHFLMLCLLSGTSKATWSKMAQCGEPAVAGALPPYIPSKTQLIFQILQKCWEICQWRASVQGMFCHFRAWVPRVLSESMATIWTERTFGVTPASLVDGCSKHGIMYTTSNNQVLSLQMLFEVYHTRWRQSTIPRVFLCLYCLGFWVFLSTHVHPCQIILQLYHIFPVRFLVTRDFPPLLIRFLITSRHGISLVTHGTCLVTRVRSKKLSTT